MQQLDTVEQQRLAFLRDGYILLPPSALTAMAEADHAELYSAANRLYDRVELLPDQFARVELLGDNLRAQVPALERLLADPGLDQALSWLLGEQYQLHPHHFVHAALAQDQPFHQDGNLPWNERGHFRSHRANWVVMFYYPQDVHQDNGPTEVVPGSQYWTVDHERADGSWFPGDMLNRAAGRDGGADPDLQERERWIQSTVDSLGIPGLERRRLTVPAGSVVLAHYDIVHRGSRFALDWPERRFMYKFYFARTQRLNVESKNDRLRASVGAQATDWPIRELGPAVEEIARWWDGGEGTAAASNVATTSAALRDATADHERISCAYRLGATARTDDAALAALRRLLLQPERESWRRAAAYGLSAVGSGATAAGLAALGSEHASVRRYGAFLLGEIAADDETIQPALGDALHQDEDDLVRSNAASALGNLAREHPARRDEIARVLVHNLNQALEPDNTQAGGQSRSTVRENVAWALAQCAAQGDLPQEILEQMAEYGLTDHDRYVRGLIADALQRAAQNAAPWLRGLIAHQASVGFHAWPAPPDGKAAQSS